MPSIKDESTVEAVARAFTSNGRNKERALKTVGYSDNYAEHRAECVLSNVGVKAAIARIDAKTAKRAEFTVEQYQNQLDEDRDMARALRQPSAAVSATVAKGRSCGYDRDNAMASIDNTAPLSDTDRQKLLDMGKALDGPKLAKEA